MSKTGNQWKHRHLGSKGITQATQAAQSGLGLGCSRSHLLLPRWNHVCESVCACVAFAQGWDPRQRHLPSPLSLTPIKHPFSVLALHRSVVAQCTIIIVSVNGCSTKEFAEDNFGWRVKCKCSPSCVKCMYFSTPSSHCKTLCDTTLSPLISCWRRASAMLSRYWTCSIYTAGV